MEAFEVSRRTVAWDVQGMQQHPAYCPPISFRGERPLIIAVKMHRLLVGLELKFVHQSE